MAEKKRKTTPSQNDGEQTTDDAASKPAGAETGHVCNVAFCPIGMVLSAAQPMKPDVVEHLLVAGREFFLAVKALLEVRADDLAKEGMSSTFEKIDIG